MMRHTTLNLNLIEFCLELKKEFSYENYYNGFCLGIFPDGIRAKYLVFKYTSSYPQSARANAINNILIVLDTLTNAKLQGRTIESLTTNELHGEHFYQDVIKLILELYNTETEKTNNNQWNNEITQFQDLKQLITDWNNSLFKGRLTNQWNSDVPEFSIAMQNICNKNLELNSNDVYKTVKNILTEFNSWLLKCLAPMSIEELQEKYKTVYRFGCISILDDLCIELSKLHCNNEKDND